MSPPRTLPGALEAAASTPRGFRHQHADGTIHDRPYAELFDAARRVAAALQRRGHRDGALIAIVAPDSDAFLTALVGVSVSGCLPATVHAPASLAATTAYLETLVPTLRVAHPAAIVAGDAIAPALAPLAGLLEREIDILPLASLLGSAAIDPVRPSLDDPALVQFTSGSTADPRGVVITHRALDANITAIGGPSGLAFADGDAGVSWLPLYHDMGLVGMALSAMYFARETTFLPALTFLKRPVEWLRAIARERATVSFAPNFAYDLCVRRVPDRALDDLDLSSWRVAGCGGEPIRAETLEAFAAKFARAGFRASSFTPCYGLAEHTLAATLSPPGRGARVDLRDGARLVSSGVSPPGHELRIVNAEGGAVVDGEVGEIEVSGPSLMRGYYHAPDATRDVMHDGWLRTGDLGYVAGGELFVCGRRKELILIHGRNFYPQDLEWAASDVDGVRRSVAFTSSARLVILVEAAPSANPEAVTGGIRARIADAYGVNVDEVRLVEAGTITHTTSGKPQRARARALYESGALAD